MENQAQTPAHIAPVVHFDAKDVAENKFVAMLSYVGILFLIPLLVKKDSKFAQEHAKQGLIICIAYIALMVVGVIPVLGWIAGFFGSLALLILDVIALVKCYQGEMWELPVIGQFRKEIKL